MLGAGDGVFKQKTGVDLEFKSLTGGSKITLVSGVNEITIDKDSEALNDLSDVSVSGSTKGDLLVNNGVNWTRLPGGGVGQFITASPLFPNGIGWVDINTFRACAHMYFSTNFGSPLVINIVSSGNWETVTGLTQGELVNIAFSASVLTVGLSGIYQITGGASLRVPGGSTDLVEWGIGINGANPTAAASFGGEELGNQFISQPINNIITLSAADNIRIFVRNLSSNRDVQIGCLHFGFVKVAN